MTTQPKTPLTDAVQLKTPRRIRFAEMLRHARRLERDRADLIVALERITESHARLENERGSVVASVTAIARAALARVRS